MEATRRVEEKQAGSGNGRRSLLLPCVVVVVAVGMGYFWHGQNLAAHPGGAISLPKLLWLSYALIAWFLVPFAFWRAQVVSLRLRRIHGIHLGLFAARGIAELWLLYGIHAWIPPYGISHDLIVIATITGLLFLQPKSADVSSDADRAARQFLTSIRIALLFEITFAALFFVAVHGATHGREGIWFASDDPRFRLINALTWVGVTLGYADLARIAWLGRDALFPRLVRTEARP